MTGDKACRTSVVRGAAIAVRDCLQSLNVCWAIYGDLAWHLLCESPTSGSWQLDIHITGDSATLAYAIQRLADMDRRFSLTTQVIDNIAIMSYCLNDIDGSSFKEHECKINLVSGPAYEFFTVQDLPLLPIQVILYRSMETHSEMSVSRLKNALPEIIAISEAYLRLPHLPPPVWSLTPAQQSLFIDYLAKITAIHPEAAGLFACLHPSSSPPPIESTLPPLEPPVPSAMVTKSTSLIETSSLSVNLKEGGQPSDLAEALLSAARTASSCVTRLGHECFLAGAGDIPWRIMGSHLVPENHRITFLVILHNGKSLGSIQHTLRSRGVLKAKRGALHYSTLLNDGKSKVWHVAFEMLPSSMGLYPNESMGTSFDGIFVINQNYLFLTMLRSVNSQGLPMKRNRYAHFSTALELLLHRNANVRAAFRDVSKVVELDRLVCACAAYHPKLRGNFAAIGFGSALAPMMLTPLPGVDVCTACGHTPPVQIPAIGAEGGVVFQAAVDAIRLLGYSGYSCAIFGSAACYLYGNQRLPNDVDILISSSAEAEAEVIKGYLVNQDPLHFYLKKAKTPGATYKVLWYRDRLNIGGRIVTMQTKVDIVMAGTMMLPFLSSRSTTIKEVLPLVPLEVLLLHKLQGWHDHMTAPEPHKQQKHTVDAVDIRCTLKIVRWSLMGNEVLWAPVALSFFQEEFHRLTMDRVKLFCSAFPDCRDDWYQLGFEVA